MNINPCATFSLPSNNDEVLSGLNHLTDLELDDHKPDNLAGLNKDILASITDWQKQEDFLKLSNCSFVYQKRMSRIDYTLAINFITGKDFDARSLADTHTALNKINQLLPRYWPPALNTLVSIFEQKYKSSQPHYEDGRVTLFKNSYLTRNNSTSFNNKLCGSCLKISRRSFPN